MQITGIKIRKIVEEERLKAIVSITFDDSLCVHDIKIIENEGNFFLAMPSKKMGTNEFRDIVHPINAEFRNIMEKSVLEEYKKLLN